MCKGRCRGASSARSSGVRQCRVPDELELRELVGLTFSLSGTLHAWESTNALRAVIHGYAPRRKSRFRRNRETANPGVEAAARSRRKIRRAARQHHTLSFRSWVRMMRCPLSMSPIEPKIWKAAQAFCLPLSRDRGSRMPVRFAMLNAWRSPRTCR